jgi:hypothetical protein
MKRFLAFLLICVGFFGSFAFAQEQRTNHYTQVTVYFAMESLSNVNTKESYMSAQLNGQIWIKDIMQRTDTTLNLHQHAFGPFALGDDPTRDSILQAEGSAGKRTLAYRAWYGMNESLKDTNNPISIKVNEIKQLTEAKVLTIVILVNSKYYVTHVEKNVPIMVITEAAAPVSHLELHNQIIFDTSSTKAKGFTANYPKEHPLYLKKQIETLLTWSPNIQIYPRKGLFQDHYGFWIPVGDDDHNVLDPDHGWKLHYLYNKGILDY